MRPHIDDLAPLIGLGRLAPALAFARRGPSSRSAALSFWEANHGFAVGADDARLLRAIRVQNHLETRRASLDPRPHAPGLMGMIFLGDHNGRRSPAIITFNIGNPTLSYCHFHIMPAFAPQFQSPRASRVPTSAPPKFIPTLTRRSRSCISPLAASRRETLQSRKQALR